MDISLKNKVAVVCGSTQGIGRACAEEIAGLGAEVILMARNEEELKKAVLQLPKNEGRDHSYVVADFSDPANVKSAIEDLVKTKKQINILINNTGGPAGGPIAEAEEFEFLNAFNQHLICNHILAKTLLPAMINSGYGRIVNIISTSVKQPIKGLGVSNTIRAAVANWSKTLSLEVGKYGITVNNVLPGFTETQRATYIIENRAKKQGKSEDEILSDLVSEIPLGRMAKPQEIATAVAFLCSPAAAYISGINVPVDGGRTACL